jgi:hypothetical protein
VRCKIILRPAPIKGWGSLSGGPCRDRFLVARPNGVSVRDLNFVPMSMEV